MSMTVELVTKLRDLLTSALQRQGGALNTWQMKVAAAGIAAISAGMAVARATQQFIRFADRITAPLDAIQGLAEGLQVSASDFAALSYVVDQAGGDASGLQAIFQKMRTAIGEASDESSTAAQSLRDIGLSYEELASKNPIEQFVAINGALSQYAGTAEQAEAATALLGRGSATLRGALNLSTAELNAGMQAAKELGVVMGDDAYAAADRFQDMLKTTKDQLNVLWMEGLQPNLPAINELLSSLLEAGRTVLPMFIEECGKCIDILAAFANALELIESVNDALEFDGVTRARREMGLLERAFDPFGTTIPYVRALFQDAGDTAEDAAPQFDVFAAAMDTVRDAANEAQAELEGLNDQLDRLEDVRQYKKEEGYQDIISAREDAADTSTEYDVDVTLTGEETKLAASLERMKIEQEQDIARIQAVQEAQAASTAASLADRRQAEITLKQARIEAENEAARVRQAAIARGIDQTTQFGLTMVHAGLAGQESWDQFWDDFAMRMFDMVMSEAFGSLLSVLSGGGSGFLGSLFGALFSSGGVVHAASGYSVAGNHFGDRVPAMLEPGERVLTRQEARSYSNGAARGETVVNLTLGSMFSSASRSDLQKAARVMREVMDAGGI